MFKFAVRLILAALGLVILMARPTVAQPAQAQPIDQIRVTFINVGAGLCTVIECPGDQSNPQPAPILYDCGAGFINRKNALTQSQVESFVRTILDFHKKDPIVVLSHPDIDHYNYVAPILKGRNAASVWLGGLSQDYENAFDNGFQEWLNTQTGKINTFEVGAFANGPACGTALTTILTVNAGLENARSLVLRIKYKDFSVTLTGDANAESLASLLFNSKGYDYDLSTTLLSSPHHGATSGGSNSFVWSQVFKPQIVVYSAGNSYFHPRCEALENYDKLVSLKGANGHELRCGQDRQYMSYPDVQNDKVLYHKAQYLTRTNGSIWITSDGGPAASVECQAIGDNGPALIPCGLQ